MRRRRGRAESRRECGISSDLRAYGNAVIKTEDRDYVSGRFPAEVWEITRDEWRNRLRLEAPGLGTQRAVPKVLPGTPGISGKADQNFEVPGRVSRGPRTRLLDSFRRP